MKTLILTIFLVSGSAWAMPNIPDGQYLGKANWVDSQGNKGTYNISIEVDNNQIKSIYQYEDKTSIYEFEVKPDKHNFFTVVSGGTEVGSGYCMNVQCHYSATFEEVKLEETLTFWQDNLYRVGSKTLKDNIVTWEEATKKVEQK